MALIVVGDKDEVRFGFSSESQSKQIAKTC